MKKKYLKIFLAIIFASFTFSLFGQFLDSKAVKVIDGYRLEKLRSDKTSEIYENIDGDPFLTKEFIVSELYLKDTVYKLPMRYNLYTDKMQYKYDSAFYDIDNNQFVDKIKMNQMVFVYVPFIKKGGYFELLTSGKCFLLQKRTVNFEPAEKPQPYADPKPDRFENAKDEFYIVLDNSKFFEINNMKSLIGALQDKKPNIESYLKQEKIKNTKKENLVKIVSYYNNL